MDEIKYLSDVDIRYIYGHVEAWDGEKRVCTGDTVTEVVNELKEMGYVYN